LNLIMVRNGEALAPGPGEPPIRTNDVFTKFHDYRAHILFEPLVEAVTNPPPRNRLDEAQTARPKIENQDASSPALQAPSPQLGAEERRFIERGIVTSAATNPMSRSSFIKEVRWAPVETIRRAAQGSDNWPLTWRMTALSTALTATAMVSSHSTRKN